MLEVMLCGAEDTKVISNHFAEVVLSFGGNPWHYLSGRVLHINSATASWSKNSQATVQKADLCVFVVLEKYGDITWSVELETAMTNGKPFLIFCLRDTYQKYRTLLRSVADPAAITNREDRELVARLRELESDLQLTIVPFDHGYFDNELRLQLSEIFTQSLHILEERNRRQQILSALSSTGRMRGAEKQILVSIALDEIEEKNSRKRALAALAQRGGFDEEEDVREILNSAEEGIQRLAFSLLPDLASDRPVEIDLADYCVEVANRVDDVGIARRLIPSLFKMDPEAAVRAFDALDLSEIGTRRRLADAIGEYELDIRDRQLMREAVDLASKCLLPTAEVNWQKRCSDLIARLRP